MVTIEKKTFDDSEHGFEIPRPIETMKETIENLKVLTGCKTDKDLAAFLGCGRTTIRNIKAGLNVKLNPALRMLERLLENADNEQLDRFLHKFKKGHKMSKTHIVAVTARGLIAAGDALYVDNDGKLTKNKFKDKK